MCGIAGILDTSGDPPKRYVIERMVQSIKHRGPDEEGYYFDSELGLGHARLSVIDLAGGKQPIHNEDRTVWVAANAEIFNYVELKRDLMAQGHRFYTESDCEVIVHLYEQYGLDFPSHLNGQFAIALWDTRKHRLVLVRDRVGIRPLFFSQRQSRLVFGSEVKSILAAPGVRGTIDAVALNDIFTYWAPLGQSTLFEGVETLRPGHILVCNGQRLTVSQYWDWSFAPSSEGVLGDPGDPAGELRRLLVDAVRLQLRADVPVAAYLSGGLDSSATVALVKHYTDSPLRTFSLVFDDAEFDESSHQAIVSSHLNTRHTPIRCRREDIRRLFPLAVWHAETAILRTAPVPLLQLALAVREQGYKVALTGEGADEVFGGYDLFKEAMIRRFWSRRPDSAWRPLLLKRLYPYLSHSPISSTLGRNTFKTGFESRDEPFFGHIPRWKTTSRIRRFLADDYRAAGDDPEFSRLRRLLPGDIDAWRPLCRDQYIEAHTLMSGYLLCSQGDRMSMSTGLEGRFPFLDHKVIEFANGLGIRQKIRGLNEKYILKAAMRDLLPEPIIARRKQPYRAPDSQCFFDNGNAPDYLTDLLSAERLRRSGYFDPVSVGRLVDKARKGEVIGFSDNMAFVGILSTMLVDEYFVRKGSDITSSFMYKAM